MQYKGGFVKDIKHLVGDRIRTLRKGKGLSQEDLGEKADLHYTYIGAVERGEKNCSLDTLSKITEGLEVDINELFNFPSETKNLSRLKHSIIEGINKCSPEAIKLLSDLIRVIETQPKGKRLTKKL